MHAFCLTRGLLVMDEDTATAVPPWAGSAARRSVLAAKLTRGRYPATHERSPWSSGSRRTTSPGSSERHALRRQWLGYSVSYQVNRNSWDGDVEWTPDARELADLELLLSGAFQPLTGFLGHDDMHIGARARHAGRRHAVAGARHDPPARRGGSRRRGHAARPRGRPARRAHRRPSTGRTAGRRAGARAWARPSTGRSPGCAAPRPRSARSSAGGRRSPSPCGGRSTTSTRSSPPPRSSTR